MRPRAFVVNEPLLRDGQRAVNLNPAESHGEVTPILAPGKPPSDLSVSLSKIREALQDATEEDFLVIVGELELVIFAALLVIARTGKVNLLRWDRDSRGYVPVTFTQLRTGEPTCLK